MGPVKIRIRFKGVNDPLCHFNSPDVKWVDVNVRVLSPGPISGLVFCSPNETRTLSIPGILPFNQPQSCYFHHKYDWIVPSGWSVISTGGEPFTAIDGGIRTFATSVLLTAPSTLMPGSTGNYNVIVRTEPAWPYPTQSSGMIWVASPGQPPIGMSSYNSNCSGNAFNTLNTSLSAACTANTPIYFQYRITDPNYSNFVFTPVSVPSGATWSASGGNLYMTVNAPPSQGSRSATIALSATGPCGPYSVNFTSTAVNYYSGGYYYSSFPNPTSETLTIEQTFNVEENSQVETGLKQSSSDLHYIRLYDFNNYKVVLEGSLSGKTEIDVSKLDKGRYILKIQIANDKEETHQVIIN